LLSIVWCSVLSLQEDYRYLPEAPGYAHLRNMASRR
jgi:hypothetical protein